MRNKDKWNEFKEKWFTVKQLEGIIKGYVDYNWYKKFENDIGNNKNNEVGKNQDNDKNVNVEIKNKDHIITINIKILNKLLLIQFGNNR